MTEYETPYFILMRGSEKALRTLEVGEILRAQWLLIRAQQQAEEALLQWQEKSKQHPDG